MTTRKKISVVQSERLISLKNFLLFFTPTPSRLSTAANAKCRSLARRHISLSLARALSLSRAEMITHDVCAITGGNVLSYQLYLLNAPTTEAFKGFIQEIKNAP